MKDQYEVLWLIEKYWDGFNSYEEGNGRIYVDPQDGTFTHEEMSKLQDWGYELEKVDQGSSLLLLFRPQE